MGRLYIIYTVVAIYEMTMIDVQCVLFVCICVIFCSVASYILVVLFNRLKKKTWRTFLLRWAQINTNGLFLSTKTSSNETRPLYTPLPFLLERLVTNQRSWFLCGKQIRMWKKKGIG